MGCFPCQVIETVKSIDVDETPGLRIDSVVVNVISIFGSNLDGHTEKENQHHPAYPESPTYYILMGGRGMMISSTQVDDIEEHIEARLFWWGSCS